MAGGAYGQAIGAGTVTDNKSQTYSIPTNGSPVGTNVHLSGFHADNVASGSTTITLTPAASCDCDIAVHEFGGMTTTPMDVASNAINNAAGSSTYDCGTTATTAQANEVVFYAATSEGNLSTPTPPSGSTLREDILTSANLPLMTADKTVSATGAQSGSFTLCDQLNCVGLIMTFKVAGASDPYPAGYSEHQPAYAVTTVRM